MENKNDLKFGDVVRLVATNDEFQCFTRWLTKGKLAKVILIDNRGCLVEELSNPYQGKAWWINREFLEFVARDEVQ